MPLHSDLFEQFRWTADMNNPASEIVMDSSDASAESCADPMKQCNKCHEVLTLDCFKKHPQTKDGHHGSCKECLRKYEKGRKDKRQRPDSDCEEEPCVLEPDALYIMENIGFKGLLKIGRSHSPETRAKQLSASQPFKNNVIRTWAGYGFLEKGLHDRLVHRRLEGEAGREWFFLSVEDAEILVQAAIVENKLQEHIHRYPIP